MRIIGALLAAYLLGSIPPGLFWGWLIKRIDVREHGSGRTGGTNVWRTVGFWAAFLTAVCDGLKGAAGIWIARALGLSPWGVALAGTAAVLGHNYSLYLKFHGGAGTMISIGIAATLWGIALPVLVLAGVGAGLLVGHASVASILIAVLLPVTFLLRGEIPYTIGFGLPTMALTLWALRPNIERLRRRAERFLPIYHKKPPPILLSNHPAHEKK